MKKRISLLSLCLGLFIAACTDSSGFEDLQNFSEKEVMPRAAGDGIYGAQNETYIEGWEKSTSNLLIYKRLCKI